MKGLRRGFIVGFGILGLLISTSLDKIANAQDVDPFACNQVAGSTAFYYGNGVLATFLDAAVSLNELQRALDANNISGDDDKFGIAYNRTDNIVADLVESVRQDLQTTFTQALRFVGGIDVLPDGLQGQLFEAAAGFDQRALDSNTDLGTHVAQYRSDIFSGRKVLIVPHSQGNFFANQAFQLLKAQNEEALGSFGLVSVANPDSFVGDPNAPEANQIYTTAFEDAVIQGLILIYNEVERRANFPWIPSPKQPNIRNELNDDDWSGHRFVASYMSELAPSRNKIVTDIGEKSQGLVSPAVVGDLQIDGRIGDQSTAEAIPGARVKVELIADSSLAAVVDTLTDQFGEYSLCVPSTLVPEQFLMIVSRDGYVPATRNIFNGGPGLLAENVSLRRLDENVIVLELEPEVHHLGDDSFGGVINSQFQKKSEGIEFTLRFSLTGQQEQATAARLVLQAKGLQLDNPVSLNGQVVGFLNTSPASGAFAEVGFLIEPVSLLQGGANINTLIIESERQFSFFGFDYDDFEFANVIIELTLPD